MKYQWLEIDPGRPFEKEALFFKWKLSYFSASNKCNALHRSNASISDSLALCRWYVTGQSMHVQVDIGATTPVLQVPEVVKNCGFLLEYNDFFVFRGMIFSIAYVPVVSMQPLHFWHKEAKYSPSFWILFNDCKAKYDVLIEFSLQALQMTALDVPSAFDFVQQIAQISLPKYAEIMVLFPDLVIGQLWILFWGFGASWYHALISIWNGAREKHLFRAAFKCFVA